MTLSRRAIAAAALVCAAAIAQAQDYPSKPIKIIVPFAPAGTTDILARLVGQKLQESWGQTVVVENRAGAGGNIGSDLVAKAPADGYTLLMGTIGTHAINASLYKKMPYDPLTDFQAVALVATVPNVLVVHPSVPAKTVKELIEWEKANRGKINYASSGVGTSIHLSAEMFNTLAGTQFNHVPYKGSGPALTDLIGGQVSLMFDNLPSAIGHIKSGKLRAVALTASKRTPALPDLPTIAESGVAGFDSGSWFGVFAPAATPKAIVDKLNAEINRITASPEMKQKLADQGADAANLTPAAYQAFVKAEMAKWADVVKASGATAE